MFVLVFIEVHLVSLFVRNYLRIMPSIYTQAVIQTIELSVSHLSRLSIWNVCEITLHLFFLEQIKSGNSTQILKWKTWHFLINLHINIKMIKVTQYFSSQLIKLSEKNLCRFKYISTQLKHVHHGVSNHWQHDLLCNSLFGRQLHRYLGLTGSISQLLMSWLLASPGHQQPWYWLWGTITTTCVVSMWRNDIKCKYMF